MDDLRASLATALEMGDQEHVARLYYWLGSCLGGYEDPLAALAFFDEGLAFTRRRGFRNFEFYIRQDRWFPLFRLGRWREILDDVEAQIIEGTASGLRLTRTFPGKITVLSLTGDAIEAARLALEHPDEDGRAYDYGPERIRGFRAQGDDAAAMALLVDATRDLREDDFTLQGNRRLDFVREAVGLGRTDLAMEIASMRTVSFSIDYPAEERSVTAVLAEANGRPADALTAFQDAGAAWRDLGNPYQAAMAALGEGRCLVGLDRAAEAASVLRQARARFEELGAAAALAETDALLRQTTALGDR